MTTNQGNAMTDCITNRDAAYLKAHADIEHENDLDDTITATLGTLICGPQTTLQQIGEMCRAFSTAEHEVSFVVQWICGKAIAHPVREKRKELT